MSYAYNADIYCDNCAEEIKRLCGEDTGDTDEYPQYVDNDEADCPQHCGDCGEFLENALTMDGYDYVKEAIMDDLKAGNDNSVAVTEWAPYYDINNEQLNSGVLDGMLCPKCDSRGPFDIEPKGTIVVDDNGIMDTSDLTWFNDSICGCLECSYSGNVEDFYYE